MDGANVPAAPPNPWTIAAIARFWAHYGAQPGASHAYFAQQVGAGIVHLLRLMDRLPRSGVFDLGCGGGDLLDSFLSVGVACSGADFSPASVATANERFATRSRWGGASVCDPGAHDVADHTQQLVTCTEVVEHLLDDDLDRLLSEIHRLLAPGGSVLITTPHAEDLDRSLIFCPFCEQSFHRMQHVRAFSVDDLRETLGRAGFEIDMCAPINLASFQSAAKPPPWPSWRAASLYLMKRAVWFRRHRNDLDALMAPGPHLVALGRIIRHPPPGDS